MSEARSGLCSRMSPTLMQATNFGDQKRAEKSAVQCTKPDRLLTSIECAVSATALSASDESSVHHLPEASASRTTFATG